VPLHKGPKQATASHRWALSTGMLPTRSAIIKFPHTKALARLHPDVKSSSSSPVPARKNVSQHPPPLNSSAHESLDFGPLANCVVHKG